MESDSQKVRIKSMQTLAQQRGKLTLVTFEQRTRSGEWRERKREVYDNGNSATILPCDAERKTVLLTRQLRLPMYLQDGLESSIEACAGKLDGETAEKRIVEEAEEELGYRIAKVQRLFELYLSPGAIIDEKTVILVQYLRERVGD